MHRPRKDLKTDSGYFWSIYYLSIFISVQVSISVSANISLYKDITIKKSISVQFIQDTNLDDRVWKKIKFKAWYLTQSWRPPHQKNKMLLSVQQNQLNGIKIN